MEVVDPFQYGGVVGPGAFCNRQEEQADLCRAAENGDRLFVCAERRMGKTSLVKRVLARLRPNGFLPVYVDLWPTDGVDSFVAVVAKALAEASETRREKLLEASKELFSRGLAAGPSLGERTSPVQPFSAEFVQAYGLRTPSNAQRAAESLLKLDLIDREGGAFVITDRFF